MNNNEQIKKSCLRWLKPNYVYPIAPRVSGRRLHSVSSFSRASHDQCLWPCEAKHVYSTVKPQLGQMDDHDWTMTLPRVDSRRHGRPPLLGLEAKARGPRAVLKRKEKYSTPPNPLTLQRRREFRRRGRSNGRMRMLTVVAVFPPPRFFLRELAGVGDFGINFTLKTFDPKKKSKFRHLIEKKKKQSLCVAGVLSPFVSIFFLVYKLFISFTPWRLGALPAAPRPGRPTLSPERPQGGWTASA